MFFVFVFCVCVYVCVLVKEKEREREMGERGRRGGWAREEGEGRVREGREDGGVGRERES